jgi:hypothetical protein
LKFLDSGSPQPQADLTGMTEGIRWQISETPHCQRTLRVFVRFLTLSIAW